MDTSEIEGTIPKEEEPQENLTDSEKENLSRRFRRIHRAFLTYQSTDSLDTRLDFAHYCQIFYGLPPEMAENWLNTGEIK